MFRQPGIAATELIDTLSGGIAHTWFTILWVFAQIAEPDLQS